MTASRRIACAFLMALAAAALGAQTVVMPPRPAGGTSVWDTSFGAVTLRQEGPLVTGTYPYADGKVVGAVSNGVLYGYWWENDDSTGCGPGGAWCGPLVLFFSPDGKAFTGYYDKAARGKLDVASLTGSYAWNGTLTSGSLILRP